MKTLLRSSIASSRAWSTLSDDRSVFHNHCRKTLWRLLCSAVDGPPRTAFPRPLADPRCRLPAEVQRAGALTLSAKKIFEIVRSVDDRNIELKELENSWASITSGGAYFKVVGLSKSEFPSLPEPPASGFTTIAGSTLSDLLHKPSVALTAG